MGQTYKGKPSERRFDGIRAITDQYLGDGYVTAGRTEIAAAIRDTLPTLGRADRWKQITERWARMIEDPEADLQWALIQGGIYCGWEAE